LGSISNFNFLVTAGAISASDHKLIQYAEIAEQVWQLILENYTINQGENDIRMNKVQEK